MAEILTKRYRCGKVSIVLTHLHRTDGRNRWEFSVFNAASVLVAHDNRLTTVHWPQRDNWKFAVKELLTFLCFADMENDELFAECATRAGKTEVEFVIWRE